MAEDAPPKIRRPGAGPSDGRAGRTSRPKEKRQAVVHTRLPFVSLPLRAHARPGPHRPDSFQMMKGWALAAVVGRCGSGRAGSAAGAAIPACCCAAGGTACAASALRFASGGLPVTTSGCACGRCGSGRAGVAGGAADFSGGRGGLPVTVPGAGRAAPVPGRGSSARGGAAGGTAGFRGGAVGVAARRASMPWGVRGGTAGADGCAVRGRRTGAPSGTSCGAAVLGRAAGAGSAATAPWLGSNGGGFHARHAA